MTKIEKAAAKSRLPDPVYGCLDEACAEQRSYPAIELFFVIPETNSVYEELILDQSWCGEGWYCGLCIGEMPKESVTVGHTLADEINRRLT